VGELDVPVEEAVLACEVDDQLLDMGEIQGVSIRAKLLQDRVGDRGRAGDVGLRLDEGSAPSVGQEFLNTAFG
jgi:hypothetical protein